MKKQKGFRWAPACLLVLFLLIGIWQTGQTYEAATSYDNAKMFYESTGKGKGKHIEVTNGTVYFATKAKEAASSSNKRYVTLGFDVTMTGNDKSLSFAVKRGGSLAEVSGSARTEGGYQYLLYQISTEDLISLAKSTGNENLDTVFSAAEITVTMDAIVSTKVGDAVAGSIEENDSGGLTESESGVYHLNNADHLKTMMDTFTGHTFESYKDIEDRLNNYLLTIYYNAGDYGNVGSGYYTGTFSQGSMTSPNMIHAREAPVTDAYRVLNEFNFRSTESFGLTRTGYHINRGSEWKKADGSVYNSATTYTPKQVDAGVGYQNRGIILYANWKPNTYTVKYDNNGGLGMVPDSSHTYDTPGALRKNSCYKEGYSLVPGAEWNTKPDGSGESYGSGAYLKKNLTSENGGVVTLYANWKEATYGIETNKDGGSGGTDVFYEQYKVDWFSDAELNNPIRSILKPSKPGYNFAGYYTYYFGMGDPIVDAAGTILKNPDYFNRNSIIYAKWEPKTFSIFFDKQGGSGGWDSVTATFDKMVPSAGNSPTKAGYSFMGYFTEKNEKNEKGTRYYNEHMSGEQYYQTDGDMTLFAHWLDETPPIVTINAPIAWSNGKDASGNEKGVQIFCKANDVGSGLDRMELYCGSTLVASRTGLSSWEKLSVETIDYYNKTEGVLQFRVVAYDVAGNWAESYATVRYDSTAPTGELTVTNYDMGNYGITITVTDYKIP